MDPVTLATTVAGLLSPLVMKGVEEVAKAGFKDLYTAIKDKLSGDPEGKQAVEEFENSPAEAEPSFQAALQKHLEADNSFYELLLKAVQDRQPNIQGGINIKQINSGKTIIAGDVGTINMDG